MARPLGSPNAPKPKPHPRITLVNPINRAGRKQASSRAVQSRGVVVVRKAPPARVPNRAVPTRQPTPVTPRQVEQRQARHQVRLKAHRQRVQAKQIKQARQNDIGQHDKQLRQITEANYYGPSGKPLVPRPSVKDEVFHGMFPPKHKDIIDQVIPHIRIGHGISRFVSGEAANNLLPTGAANVGKLKIGQAAVSAGESNVNDVLNMAANTPASVALTIAHPKKTIEQFPKTDPLGRLIFHGDPSLILKHPAVAMLEVAGLKSAVGNTAGRVARSGALGKGAKDAASLARPDLKAYANTEGGPATARRYSGDVIQKGLQVFNENRKAKKGQDPHVATGRKQRKMIKKMGVDELAVSEGLRRRATAEQGSAAAQSLTPTHSLKVRAPHLSRTARQAKKLRTEGVTSAHQQAAPLIVDNTIRDMPHPQVEADLQNRLRVLSKVDRSKLSHAMVERHDNQVAQAKGLLADQKFLDNPAPAFEAAAKIKQQQLPRTQLAKDKQLLSSEDQSAPYVPYAINHMGAQPAKDGLPQVPVTAAEHTKLVSDATAQVTHHRAEAARLSQTGDTRRAQAALNKVKQAEGDLQKLSADTANRSLTVPEIQAHMKANNVAEPGFFSQRPGSTGRGSFYSRVIDRKGGRVKLPPKPRTGTSTAQGTYESGPDALVAQAAHEANVTTQAGNLDRMTGQFGIGKPAKDPKDRFFKTHSEAHTAAKELGPVTGNVDRHGESTLVPMSVGRAKAIHDLIDSAAPDAKAAQAVSDMVNEAFTSKGAGQYTLVPYKFQQMLQDSVKPSPDWQRTLENVTRVWKKTILTTSTKWMFGNMVDLGVRAALSGVGPLDVVRGRQVMRGLERTNPEQARILMERTQTSPSTGGLFGGSAKLDRVNPSRLSKHNPLRIPATGWRWWTNGISRLNTSFEHAVANGMIGRDARKQVRTEVGSMNKIHALGEKAFADYTKGLLRTPEQVRLGNEVEKVIGRWGKLGPDARGWLVHAPFVQWLFVSTKFVFATLPREHPIKTAILASLSQLTEEERKQLGLNIDISHIDPNALKSYLQGGVMHKGGIIPFQRYTSFGTLAQGLPGIASFFVPQYSSIRDTLNAKTFTGQPIKNPDGSTPSDTQLAGLAAYQFAEGFVPFGSDIRRIREKGGVSAPGSTFISPKTLKNTSSTLGAGLNKTFNPLRPLKPVRNAPRTSTGGSSSGGGGFGGGGFGGSSGGSSSGGGFGSSGGW